MAAKAGEVLRSWKKSTALRATTADSRRSIRTATTLYLLLRPTARHIHIGSIQLADRIAAEQFQRAVEIGTKNLQSARNASFTGSSQTIRVGFSAENSARSQAESLYYVRSTADATIEQNFSFSINRRNNIRQHAQRCGNTIELSTSMIRDYDGCRAMIERTLSIFCCEHTFNDDRPFPEIANPCHVLPEEGSSLHRSMRIANSQRTFFWKHNVGHGREPSIEQESRQPSRMRE